MYGSSHLGIINRDQDADEDKLTAVDEDNLGDTYLLNFTRGNKLFELTNHLGNVLTVLSDKKTGRKASDPSMISIYDFDMVTAADYTPFGRVMLGRNFAFLSRYRYGFNGKEMDNEVKGAGNLLDYGNRLYDPLVGRFMSVDPLTKKYPWYTPYQFAGNKPIWATDLDGLEEMPTNRGNEEHQAQTTHATVSSTKGPFSETVSKTWFWHKGSNEYGTKSGWYEGEDYKRLVWPISADLAGYADMYKTPGIGKNWSDEEKANVANTKLGQFISSGLSEKEVKGFLSQAYNVSMTQAANSSGRAEFAPVNVEDLLVVGQLVKLGAKALLGGATKTSTALVTKYPAIAEVTGTAESTFLMPGQVIDRYGELGGKWFSTPGTSYGARSIPPGSSPYTQFKVLKPFEVQKSVASPGMFSGQTGFGIQFQSPVGADILIKRGIIEPFKP